jgi:hypothetical protein
MMKTFITQKRPKPIPLGSVRPAKVQPPPRAMKPGQKVAMKVFTASPPMKTLMPNQPQATSARMMVGTLAPSCPKLDRASTGKVMPYLVPGWALSRMGTSTIRLPRPMTRSDCHQFIPCDINPPARV